MRINLERTYTITEVYDDVEVNLKQFIGWADSKELNRREFEDQLMEYLSRDNFYSLEMDDEVCSDYETHAVNESEVNDLYDEYLQIVNK